VAVTSLWPIKGNLKGVIDYARNPEKTVERRQDATTALHTMGSVVEYAANEEKTETRAYVTCLNCTGEETAAEEFWETKIFWGKTKGRLCFHGYQSFQAEEVDAQTAHKIGVELAEQLWGDRFQVVVATHCNTGHYHNHFVLNAVSFLDGSHFDNRREDYQAMRRASDALCRKYRLSVIEAPAGRGRNHGEYLAEKSGKPTQRGLIRGDIDRAILASVTREDFFQRLEAAGYALKLYQKSGDWLAHPALKPPGAKGFFRFHKLGDGYTLEEISRRIQRNLVGDDPFPEAEREEIRLHRRNDPPPLYSAGKPHLYRLYLRYCYELHILAAHPASVRRVSFLMREDLTKLERLDAQTQFLGRTRAATAQDLLAWRAERCTEMETLEQQRSGLRNALRRQIRHRDPVGAEEVKGTIRGITERLRQMRKEVRLCDEILTRSAQTEEELAWLLREQARDQRKEENTNELFGRCGRASGPAEPGGG
jgi:hypothetical protein